jgi:PTS system mannose-specific IIB component
MSVIIVRIDDRLVHGQIVQGWLKNISVEKIAVASDFVAKDNMQKLLMGLAVPNTIELEILSLEDICKAIVSGKYDKPKTMIIAAKPIEVLTMVERGADFKSINVGGMHYGKDKIQILQNVFVDEADMSALLAISQKGIELEGRILPLDERTNVAEAIKKHKVKDAN